MKFGPRRGDNAPISLIEFVGELAQAEAQASGGDEKPKAKRSKKAASAGSVDTESTESTEATKAQ